MRKNTNLSLNMYKILLRYFSAVLLLSLVPLYSRAQEVLTLEEAMRIALQNNYAIQVSRNDVEIATNNVTPGNAGMLPTLDLSAGYSGSATSTRQEYNTGLVADRNGAISTTLGSRIDLNWTIFNGMRMFVSYDRLKEIEQFGKATARNTIETTIAQVITTYYDIARQQRLISVYEDAVALSQERMKIARARTTVGSASGLETLQAQVDLNTDSSALLQQQVSLSTTKVSLNVLLVRKADMDFRVPDSIASAPLPSYEELKNNALSNNSVVQLAQSNRNIAQYDLQTVDSYYYPSIGVNVGYVFSEVHNQVGLLTFNRGIGPVYGITASFNIFNGFNIDRQAENAKIAIQSRELDYNQAKAQVEGDLTRAWQTYQTNLRLMQFEESNVQAARRSADLVNERYRAGTITALELREAQNNYVDAQGRLVTARYQVKLAETSLLHLSGKLVQ